MTVSEGCIYALCEPSGKIRYIGQTRDLRARLGSHRHAALTRRITTHLGTWLRSMEGQPMVRVVEENIPLAELDARERYWIREFRHLDLVNATEGGPGTRNPTKEVRRKMGSGRRGYRASAEQRARMSAAQIKRYANEPVGQETRRKQRKASLRNGNRPPSPKGRKATAEARANMSAAQKGLKRKGEMRKCRICQADFYVPLSEIKRGNGHYCSKSCSSKDIVKRRTYGPLTSEHRAKIAAATRDFHRRKREAKEREHSDHL